MPALAPAALEALDRKFVWPSYCGCGAPAEVFGVHPSRTSATPEYYCRACWGGA